MRSDAFFAVACCAWLLGVTGANAASLDIAPSADTYIEPYGSETKNHGSEAALRLDQWGGRQVLLRFPLGEIPKAKRLLRASLRLFITDVGFNEAGECPDLKTCVGLFDLVTPWTEEGATFNTADGRVAWSQGPGIAGGKYADVGPLPKPDIGVYLNRHTIPLEPPKAGSWLELDVAAFVRDRVRAGDREANLLLRSSVLARSYSFRSREAKEEAERPQLAVEWAGALPDFTLEGGVSTDWRPGRRLAVRLKGVGAVPAPARWRFTRKPGASRLQDASLKPGRDGATFVPDAPGLYRVSGEVPTGTVPTAESAEVYALSVQPHPRLYVTPERLVLLRRQMREGTRLCAAFKVRVEAGNAGLADGRYHDFGPPEGCEENALAYLLTGDAQYARNSMAYARIILKMPMREHFRDVHEATFTGASWVHAMSVHYDWCYDQAAPQHRRAAAEWLKEAASWSWVRAGRPIAHNDGGGRQILLAAPALALLGDDPEAPELLRRCHANFDESLLPWLNGGGRGGRSGDGGEYEGLHSFFLVRYAWMARTATGEDVFLDSPYYRNRIRHILFGWYPRRLVERNGQYSMRTYYSPGGDHIRLGYVGDTQPYQSAAALCDRFRDTPEAQGLRWLAGEWPTQWMQYCLKWAILGDFDGVPAREPKALSYRDEGFHTAYFRSDWSDDATWVLFENGPYVSVHQSLDKGGFEIFKGDLLAARTGNLDHGNVGARHSMAYLHRTISGNCLLVNDPAEKWKGFLGGAEGTNDGGGQRTNYPLTSGPDAEAYLAYRPVFQRGAITRYADLPSLSYACADLTDAYNSPQFHGGGLNKPKVTRVTRQLLYLRGLDTVAVFDRVAATDPAYKKTWLLHSLGDLDVLDGKEEKVDDGEFRYTGATRAVIRYGWPKPVPSAARCLSVTLLPEGAAITKIGGRVDLPEGETDGCLGDQWHGKHRHRHLKDFWVNGANYPPGNAPETRWFGDPATQWYVPGTPDETGGRGKWRIEVSPPTPARENAFFHVLCPRLGREGDFPEVARIAAGPFAGALIGEAARAAALFFSLAEEGEEQFEAVLPAGKTWVLVVADMAPGTYSLTLNAKPLPAVIVGDDRLLAAAAVGGGAVRATRRKVPASEHGGH